MRILLISSSSGSRGGGEPYLTYLAEGLLRLGHEVEVWVSNHKRMDELVAKFPSACTLRRISYRNTYDRRTRSVGALLDLSTRRRLRAEIAASKVDLVHVNKQNLEDGLDLLLAASESGKPIVCTIHITRPMVDLGALGGRIRDRIALTAIKSARCQYITISTQCAIDLRRVLPLTSGIHRVLNGVPEPPKGDRRHVRVKWGIADCEILIGAVGRLEVQKNPLFLTEVLEQLPNKFRAIWFGDGSLRGKLEEEILKKGLQNRFFVAGWQEDVRSLLIGLDLFVQPSLYEGLSLALLEAAAAGLPLITADVEGVTDVIKQGENGFTIPIANLQDWIDVLHKLSDGHLRDRVGKAARDRYTERFSVSAMAEGTEAVYSHALNTGKPA